MKLFGSAENKITMDEKGENVTQYTLVLVHCNSVKTDYQRDSKLLHTFVPNESFGQLLDISPKLLYF